jgi:hypothetical protein
VVRPQRKEVVTHWKNSAGDSLSQPADWYDSDEAIRIAGNVLLYQRLNGGWPRNVDMADAWSRKK